MMEVINFDQLKENKLIEIIKELWYKKFQNKGNRHFSENMYDTDLINGLNKVFHQMYLLKSKKLKINKFKEDLYNFKKESVKSEFQKKENKKTEIYIGYSGEFVFYSSILYSLYYRSNYDDIQNSSKDEKRIYDILQKNYKELERNPVNYIILDPINNLFSKNELTNEDVEEYVNNILDDISTFYKLNEEKKVQEDRFEEMDIEELETIGQKVMLMNELGILEFIQKKYGLSNSPNHLSKVIHCFTGINQSSINSIINTFNKPYIDQKNNPYNNKNNKAKVEAKIIELRLKL